MYTIIETPVFQEDARKIWSEEDHGAFCTWLAQNPQAGDVIPGTGGCRKVRWSRTGSGPTWWRQGYIFYSIAKW